MQHAIIFPNDDGSISLMQPCDCGLSLNEIARKDVPRGKPYLLVPQELIPQDQTFFDAFEADFSNPDGFGVGPQVWFIEQFEAEIATLDPEKDTARIAQLQQMIAVQQAEMNA